MTTDPAPIRRRKLADDVEERLLAPEFRVHAVAIHSEALDEHLRRGSRKTMVAKEFHGFFYQRVSVVLSDRWDEFPSPP